MTFLKLLKKHWRLSLSLTLTLAILAFFISLFQPQEYETLGRLLIVPKGTLELDAYGASRVGERLGGILKEVIYSNSFLDKVLASNFEVKNDYPQDLNQRLKKWQRRVKVEINSQSGTLELKIYHPQKTQSYQVALALLTILQQKGPGFFGGRGVEIKLLDEPMVSEKPVRPRILLNTLAGGIFGLLLSFGIFYLFTDELERLKKESFVAKRQAYPPPDLPKTPSPR